MIDDNEKLYESKVRPNADQRPQTGYSTKAQREDDKKIPSDLEIVIQESNMSREDMDTQRDIAPVNHAPFTGTDRVYSRNTRDSETDPYTMRDLDEVNTGGFHPLDLDMDDPEDY
jgi:hypothetical protein